MKLSASILCSIALGAQTVFGKPILSRTAYNVKERHNPPRAWKNVGRAAPDHKLHLKIGLKQGNFEELDRQLYEVSSPDHPRYGQHLSLEDVQELVRPKEDTIDLVHEWLLTNEVADFNYSPAKDWINIYVNVAFAERLLDTEYSVFMHEDGTAMVRTTQWSIPAHLHEHVDTIQPTTSFMRNKAQKADWIQLGGAYIPPSYTPPSNATIAKACNVSVVTIECFRTLYGTIDYEPKSAGINKVAWNNYLNQTPIRPDDYTFLKLWRPEAADTAWTYKSVEIAGGPAAQYTPLTPAQLEYELDVSDFVEEANLDSQTILGMTFPTPITSFSTGGSPPWVPDLGTTSDTNEPYLAWVSYVSAQPNDVLPQVISSSYGDDEQTVPESYAQRVCQEFAQLGARGISLFISSGDGGLGGLTDEYCVSNDGKNTPSFMPEFPSSCPYVTSVGALQNFEPQEAVFVAGGEFSYYASGSGFSNYFDRPSYQNGIVDKYVAALNGLHDGLYNKGGRGYPDVSAQGLNFAFVFNYTQGVISGTSASTPLFSSIISLVNDALIAAGKPTLGFLNPWLYSKGYKGLTDILTGNTTSCGTSGFPVTKGWDPVTGFGSPIFPELVSLALSS